MGKNEDILESMIKSVTEKPPWVPLIVNIPIDNEKDTGIGMNELMGLTLAMIADGYEPTGVPALATGSDGISVILFQWFVLSDVDPDDDDQGDMDDD